MATGPDPQPATEPGLAGRALRLWWIPAIAAAVLAVAGPLGFNPSDDSFILGAAKRLLEGQVPHRDMISPRPVGSAVLHLPDVLLPGPTLLVSKGLAALELTVATTLLAGLGRRTPPWRWGPGFVLAVAAATLVNLHVFPLTAWHTVDGVLLVAVALTALRRGLDPDRPSTPWRLVGLVVAGAAVTVKQSFFAAPFLALGWSLWAARRDGRLDLRRVATDLVASAAIGLAYLVLVSLAGGFEVARVQLLSSDGVWGEDLLSGTWSLDGIVTPLVLAGLAATAVAVTDRLGARAADPERSGAGAPDVVGAVAAAGLTALVVWVPFGLGDLGFLGEWSRVLWWIGVIVAVGALVGGRRPWALLATLAVGWMVSLSWGYGWPSLVGGSLALATATEVWRGRTALRPAWLATSPRAAVAGGLAGLVLLGVVGDRWVDLRRTVVYRDRPAEELTFDLGTIDPDLWGVRTNPTTGAYLQSILDCVERYPASRVAIVPDNAALYELLELDNPLLADWLSPGERADQEDRLLAAAEELDGDVLVLGHPIAVREIWPLRELPMATIDDVPYSYTGDVVARLLDRVEGERITCGPFVGVWAPADGSDAG